MKTKKLQSGQKLRNKVRVFYGTASNSRSRGTSNNMGTKSSKDSRKEKKNV
jgi:hypothetical protein